MSDLSLYFDYAAATPVSPAVFVVMQPYFSEQFYNPSATYMAGQAAKKALEQARADVAQHLGVRNSEIIFTAGGTESTNLAIHGVMQAYPGAGVLVSAIEHEAVLAPAACYGAQQIPVNEQGIVDIHALERLVTDTTVLVSVMYANNEVGAIQPIRAIAQLLDRIRSDRRHRGIVLPIFLHSDACQAALYLDVHVSRLGVDLLTLNGGKMYGPKQSGILYASSRVTLKPQILGGGQERGVRSGTENVAFAVGFAKALGDAQSNRHEYIQRQEVLRDYFLQEIKTRLPDVAINGSLKHRLPNNVHITILGQDNERLLFGLDEAGIMAAAGSACSASDDEPSHVLRAMGLDDAAARSSLRFTTGVKTTQQAIDHVIATLVQYVRS